MKQIKTKALSMLMAAVMVFAMAPLGTGIAFATEGDEGQPVAAGEETPAVDVEAADEVVVDEVAANGEAAGEEVPAAAVNEEPVVKAADGEKAATEYKLWIGDVQVTSDTTSGDGWTYSGNETKGTLTLQNATITDTHDDLGKEVCIDSADIDLTLHLEGNNVVGDGTAVAIEAFGGNLTVEGTGTLNVIGSTCAIYAEYNLIVNNGNITAKTEGDGFSNYTVHAAQLNVNGGTLTSEAKAGEAIRVENLSVKNSTLHATATGEYANGIRVSEGIDISNATVTSKATNNYGKAMFWNGGDCKINKGNVDLTAANGGALIFGIEESALHGNLIIYDSTVTAHGSIETIDDITIKNSTVSAECENNGYYYGPAALFGHTIAIENSQVNGKGYQFGIAAMKAELDQAEPIEDPTCKINIKDSRVTAEAVYGMCSMGEINMSYTGKGKYATRVEAIAAEPETPAIFSKKINKGKNLKVVLPKGGVIKSVPNEGIETVYDASAIADHVIIEAAQDTTPKAVKQVFLAKAKAKGKKALKIDWMKYQGAGGYDIFLCACDNGAEKHSQKLIKTIKGNKTFAWTKKGLRAKKKYKLYVKAWKMQNGKKTYLAMSNTMHVFTSGKMGKYTNPKGVKVSTNKVSLAAGKSYQIKAKVTKLKKNKKLMRATHTKVLRYISSNPGVATVSGAGVITAKAKGKCTIYVFAANGARQAVTVNVR